MVVINVYSKCLNEIVHSFMDFWMDKTFDTFIRIQQNCRFSVKVYFRVFVRNLPLHTNVLKLLYQYTKGKNSSKISNIQKTRQNITKNKYEMLYIRDEIYKIISTLTCFPCFLFCWSKRENKRYVAPYSVEVKVQR